MSPKGKGKRKNDKKGSDASPSPKKKRVPLVKVETLLNGKQWDEVRVRLKRVHSGRRIGNLLYHCADDPDVPDDVFELLLGKLKDKREGDNAPPGEGSLPHCIKEEFWGCVCNFNTDMGCFKKFGTVCEKQTVSSLRIFLKEFVDIVGPLHMHTARETICHLWALYFVPERGGGGSSSYWYREYTCNEHKEDELLAAAKSASLEDLQSNNPKFYTLWQKTVMLIQMTQKDGLDTSCDIFPLIHNMIEVHVPRVIIWLALKLYPQQAQLVDDDNRLPLHYACVENNYDTYRNFSVKFPRLDDQDDDDAAFKGSLVELVLDAYPAAAKQRDHNGSHPLALLLHLEYTSWSTNDWTQRCALALLKLAPEALHCVNAENHMLPFLTAAAIHDDNTCKAYSKAEERTMLTRKTELAYTILRQDPLVLLRGIKETSREIHLKLKLQAAQDTIQQLEEEKRKLQEQVARLKKGGGDTSSTSDSTEESSKMSNGFPRKADDCSKDDHKATTRTAGSIINNKAGAYPKSSSKAGDDDSSQDDDDEDTAFKKKKTADGGYKEDEEDVVNKKSDETDSSNDDCLNNNKGNNESTTQGTLSIIRGSHKDSTEGSNPKKKRSIDASTDDSRLESCLRKSSSNDSPMEQVSSSSSSNDSTPDSVRRSKRGRVAKSPIDV